MKTWRDDEIDQVHVDCDTKLDHNIKMIFNLEQKLKLLEYKLEVDGRSFTRRVQGEVADKSYDLVFRVDQLQRQNQDLQNKIDHLHVQVKDELRIEYEDSVMKLTHELMMVKGKFSEYRRSLLNQMQNKFEQVKKDALIQIATPSTSQGSASFKQKALRIVMDDNEIAKLKRETEDQKSLSEKLIILNKLKLLTLRGKYERRVRQAEDEKENAKKIYFGNKSKIEERENLLRQQLMKTQQLLSNMEMEVERLRKDLQLQIKNKQKLVNWKVKNAQLLDELEVKVEKYERWNKVDVDKILLELEKKKQELEHYTKTKTKDSKKSDFVENKSKKTIDLLKKKIVKERDMKEKVLQKMEEMHQDKDQGHEAGTWQRRYFDAMADLQSVNAENSILRQHLEKIGTDASHVLVHNNDVSPTSAHTPDVYFNDAVSVSSQGTFSSRPMSAASGSGTRRNYRQTLVPHLNIGRQPSTIAFSSEPTPNSAYREVQHSMSASSLRRPSTSTDHTSSFLFDMDNLNQRSGTSQTVYANSRPMAVMPGYRVRSTTPTSNSSRQLNKTLGGSVKQNMSSSVLSQSPQMVVANTNAPVRPRSAGVNIKNRVSSAGPVSRLGSVVGVVAPVKRPSTATYYQDK
ncbi:hypothetical protein AKO1_013367, partial [Acrasis kona]